MDITLLLAMLQAVYKDKKTLNRFALGDKRASRKNKHDVVHANFVRDVAVQITVFVHAFFPWLLDEVTREIVIPLAAFLHDNGYADGDDEVNDHAVSGGGWAFKHLLEVGFPMSIARRVADIIANHRSKRVLDRKFDDPAHAIVVIADKCVGDEDRVRAWPAFFLRTLRSLGLCRFWRYHKHERVNLAIPNAQVVVDGKKSHTSDNPGAIVLKLQVDDGFCAVEDIYGLYKKRFCACDKAAQYLGFLFRLEFNGVRYMYVEAQDSWVPVKTISVTTPE